GRSLVAEGGERDVVEANHVGPGVDPDGDSVVVPLAELVGAADRELPCRLPSAEATAPGALVSRPLCRLVDLAVAAVGDERDRIVDEAKAVPDVRILVDVPVAALGRADDVRAGPAHLMHVERV